MTIKTDAQLATAILCNNAFGIISDDKLQKAV